MDTALLFDAVYLFAEALETLGGKQVETMQLQCSDTESWKYGLSVHNTMSTVSKVQQFANNLVLYKLDNKIIHMLV